MSQFGDFFITNKGANLLSKVMAGGTLTFTRLALGNGIWINNGVDDPDLEGLYSEKISLDVQSVVATGGGMANISTVLLHSDLLSSGFEGREIGVFATDPDDGEILYCAAYAGDLNDWIPAVTEVAAYEHIYNVSMAIGNATTVNVTVDPSIVTATLQDLYNHAQKQLDPTDEDPIKEKHLSNLQAKKWEDHVADTILHMGRNILINGGLDIWQRGTSLTKIMNQDYVADRWKGYSVGSTTMTISRQTSGLNGSLYSARIQRQAADNGINPIYFVNVFESINSIPYRGKYLTLSFLVKKGSDFSEVGSSLSIRVQSGTGEDEDNLSVWSELSNLVNEYQIVTPIWQKLTFTSTNVIDDSVTQLAVQFSYIPTGIAGENDWFEVSQIQIEQGKIATEFEKRTYGEELASCQRYFEKLPYQYAGIENTTGIQYCPVSFKVKKRIIPTIGGTIDGTILGIDVDGFYITKSGDSPGIGDGTAVAEL